MTNQKSHEHPLTSDTHESLGVSDDQKAQEVAQLNKMFNTPLAEEPSHETTDEPDAALIYTFEESDFIKNPEHSTSKKITSRFSEAGLFLTATDLASRISSRIRAGRERREAQYAVEADDNRRQRMGKFLGRNAVRLATGTFMAFGTVVAYGVTHKLGSDMSSVPLAPGGDHVSSHMDVMTAADTRFIVGGRGDGTGTHLTNAIDQMQGHGAKNTVRIQYPAEIAPMPGDKHTLDQSSQIASDQLYNAYKQSGNKNVEFIAFSEGTQGVQKAANRIAAENGGVLPKNLKITLIASPQTAETGFFNTPYAKMTAPMLKAAGIDINQPIPPGVNVGAMSGDFWAGSANVPVTSLLNKLIGINEHKVPTADMPHTSIVKDGTTYTTYYNKSGPQTAILRRLDQETNIPVTKAMDNFGQAIAPDGQIGVGAKIDANKVVSSAADLAKEGLHDRGIKNVDRIIDQVAAAIPRPQAQQMLDLLSAPNAIGNNIPSGGSGSDIAANIAPKSTPAVANIPTPAAPVEQVSQVVNDTAEQVKKVVPREAQGLVNNVQRDFNNFLGNFRPRR